MPSFTTQVPNLQESGPVVTVKLTVGSMLEDVLRRSNQNIPAPVEVSAMIDTGASGTVVREDIVSQLNLNPIGMVQINTPSSTNVQCYEYLIRVIFPNNVIVETVAIAVPLQGQNIQCLVGREVLQHGVFIYTGYINAFTLSF